MLGGVLVSLTMIELMELVLLKTVIVDLNLGRVFLVTIRLLESNWVVLARLKLMLAS